MAATSYPYVYVEQNHVFGYVFYPLTVASSITMLIAVLVMRCGIRDAPNMHPNEKAVLTHVFIFPVFAL